MSATCLDMDCPRFAHRRGLRDRLSGMREFLAAVRARSRARRALLAADPRMLADLGISQAQAQYTALSERLG